MDIEQHVGRYNLRRVADPGPSRAQPEPAQDTVG